MVILGGHGLKKFENHWLGAVLKSAVSFQKKLPHFKEFGSLQDLYAPTPLLLKRSGLYTAWPVYTIGLSNELQFPSSKLAKRVPFWKRARLPFPKLNYLAVTWSIDLWQTVLWQTVTRLPCISVLTYHAWSGQPRELFQDFVNGRIDVGAYMSATYKPPPGSRAACCFSAILPSAQLARRWWGFL